VHAAEPVVSFHVPAAHAVQAAPSGPVYPTLQVQAATLGLGAMPPTAQATQDVAPDVVEYVPAPQSVHAALPVAVLYLPAIQAVHEPAGPVYPALHSVEMQAVLLELPPIEVVLAGHARQFVSIVAPTVAEYFPEAQSVHVVLAVVIVYLPATHDEHTPPSAHPVTCTSAICKKRPVPYIEMWRY